MYQMSDFSYKHLVHAESTVLRQNVLYYGLTVRILLEMFLPSRNMNLYYGPNVRILIHKYYFIHTKNTQRAAGTIDRSRDVPRRRHSTSDRFDRHRRPLGSVGRRATRTNRFTSWARAGVRARGFTRSWSFARID